MNAEKLNITLPAAMAQTIRAAVATGGYASDSEVVHEAMRLWQDRRAEHERRQTAIRAKIQEAVDDPARITGDEIARHFDERLANAEKPPLA